MLSSGFSASSNMRPMRAGVHPDRLRTATPYVFMRIPFDQRTVSGIPWTRMPGSAIAGLSPIHYRRQLGGWVIAAALALGGGAILLRAEKPLTPKHENRHHEIDQLEDQWRDAILTSNTKVLDSLLSNDYMAITPSGTVQDKDETLANFRDGRVRFTALTFSDQKVRFYGNTAVVTSLADIQATTPDGPVAGSYRYTRVYVKNAQGEWKIVSFEASRVRELGPHQRNEFH